MATFWSLSVAQILPLLKTTAQGLTGAEASTRLTQGSGELRGGPSRAGTLLLLLSQFKSPIILVLIFASSLSFFLKDAANGAIILFIILVSGVLGFWQERGAADAVQKLLVLVQVTVTCQRDGKPVPVPAEQVVAGYANPIDQAIVAFRPLDITAYKKLDEGPYDFVRKRLSVLVSQSIPGAPDTHLMVTKGALASILEVCTMAQTPTGDVVPLDPLRAQIQTQYAALSGQGFRTLGIASRDVGTETNIGKDHEAGMTFAGFRVLFNPLQEGIIQSLQSLRGLGVSLKLITGDNALVAATISKQAGMTDPHILTGPDLHTMSQEALTQRAPAVDVFAEVEPNQKERIILALQKAGHVVGYIGDGINDASALHAADVGISVAGAVDVARESADIILLEKDLEVLAAGGREGRVTFANTLKDIFMATSANFGNMFSMAGASLFLPLLPKQVLLTDFPAMTIAGDSVDPEMVDHPRRWDIRFMRRFMIIFGLVSSVFDYVTFGVLLWLMRASTAQFRTGWFVESVCSAALIVLVVRTRKRFYRSHPSRPLLFATFAIVAVVLALPCTPLASLLGLVPLGVSNSARLFACRNDVACALLKHHPTVSTREQFVPSSARADNTEEISRQCLGNVAGATSVHGKRAIPNRAELDTPVPLPKVFLLALGAIVTGYVGAAEVAKSIFYRHAAF